MRLAGIALMALLLGLGGLPAHAASKNTRVARKYFKQAQRRAKAGDFAAAVRLLQKAYDADPQPKYVANQGIAYFKMKQYELAAERFDWFLERVQDPDAQALAESFVMKMRPQVFILTQPSGAQIYIDQKLAGTAPVVTELLVGRHLVRAELDGHHAADETFVVELNTSAKVTLELREDPMALVSGSSLAPTEPEVLPPPPPPPPPARGWGSSDWGWTMLATGAALGVGGAVFGTLAFDATDQRDAAISRADWRSHQSSAEGWAAGYYTASGLALTSVTTGLTLLLLDD